MKDGLKVAKKRSLTIPDGKVFTVIRSAKERNYFQLVTLEVKGGEIAKETISEPDVFGIQMGKLITAIEEAHQ